ncbi:hypothetical protein TVAG_483320 [Trichomonas vaginalis G3]|uniref:Uncharacterized protein n=1 Tax=Trichomonas vaginalis (strain ATCC PRA-98 / G3) TaxID=412133 RepID=A2ETA5_TRIV3|nr:hypothetical protein TVAGG3_0620280 [Trichomonas vaginalis G3]EAY04095.1 hypothetical protein TVAG_483320 [Trichomonas vaginalis G3]KAI5503845.1 hypothetical protein TVAGG3_0620280 [Trichomonas vaginalis G3]|eukprot:XP_001316318.1 hypothetical protein [Trichomonas vaginalis G3]
MDELKISPSQILFEFAKEASDTGLCYGLGRSEPYVPFLFKSNSFFSYDWSPSIDGIRINPKQKRKISRLLNNVSNDYYQSSMSFICSVAESYIFRASLDEWECNICHARFQQEDGIQHVCDCHPAIFADSLQKHIDIISNENDSINNMTTKLQFDATAVQPSTPFEPVLQQRMQIKAPYLSEDDISFDEEEDSDDLDFREHLDSQFPQFSNADYPIDMPIPPVISNVLRSPSIDVRQCVTKTRLLNYDQEDMNRADTLLKPLIDLISSPFQPQSSTENQSKNSSKQQPKKTQQQASPQITQSQPIQPQAQQQQNSQNSQPIQPNLPQNVPTTSKSEPIRPADTKDTKEPPKTPKSSIHDLTPDEMKEFEGLDHPKKSKKPSPPKTISFIETIPEDIQNEAIESVVELLLNNYVESNAMHIIKPTLSNRKKEMAKRAKEEKELKKRQEDQKRKQAFQQKRQECLDKMASCVSIPLIRSFVLSEIENIFEDEKKKLIAEAEKETTELTQMGNLPPPILVSGLLSYSSNKISDIIQLFSNCEFVKDEENNPKIRFRLVGNRMDVLVYLQNKADVKKMLEMTNPMMVNCQQVSLSVEHRQPEMPEIFKCYTGQEMVILSKNIDLSNVKYDMYAMTSGMCAPEYQIKDPE